MLLVAAERGKQDDLVSKTVSALTSNENLDLSTRNLSALGQFSFRLKLSPKRIQESEVQEGIEAEIFCSTNFQLVVVRKLGSLPYRVLQKGFTFGVDPEKTGSLYLKEGTAPAFSLEYVTEEKRIAFQLGMAILPEKAGVRMNLKSLLKEVLNEDYVKHFNTLENVLSFSNSLRTVNFYMLEGGLRGYPLSRVIIESKNNMLELEQFRVGGEAKGPKNMLTLNDIRHASFPIREGPNSPEGELVSYPPKNFPRTDEEKRIGQWIDGILQK